MDDYYTEIEGHAAEAERLIREAEPGSPHETAGLRLAVGRLILCIRALRGEVEALRQRTEAPTRESNLPQACGLLEVPSIFGAESEDGARPAGGLALHASPGRRLARRQSGHLRPVPRRRRALPLNPPHEWCEEDTCN